jgi:hypothetical protein
LSDFLDFPDRSQQGARQRGRADQDIRHQQVGLVVGEGRLLCEGAPREVVRDPRVIDAYLGGAAA